jgi:hypothetical protein
MIKSKKSFFGSDGTINNSAAPEIIWDANDAQLSPFNSNMIKATEFENLAKNRTSIYPKPFSNDFIEFTSAINPTYGIGNGCCINSGRTPANNAIERIPSDSQNSPMFINDINVTNVFNSGNYTVCFSIYVGSITGTQGWFSSLNRTVPLEGFGIYTSSNTLRAFQFRGGTPIFNIAIGTVSVGNWYFVCISRNGTSLRVRFDSTFLNNIAGVSNSITSNFCELMCYNGALGSICATGIMDNLIIWNSQIDDATGSISNALYNGGTPAKITTRDSLIYKPNLSGIQCLYPFSVSNRVEDVSVNINHGSLGGSAFFSANGLVCNSNGDYFSAPNLLNIGTNFSLSMWIKYNSVPSGNSYLICFYQDASNYWFISNGTSILRFGSLNGGSTTNPLTASNINDTNLHHIAITKSGNTWKLFLDNVIVASNTIALTTVYTSGNLYLSCRRPSELHFLGITDDVRIYNRDISLEVSNIFDAGKSTPKA